MDVKPQCTVKTPSFGKQRVVRRGKSQVVGLAIGPISIVKTTSTWPLATHTGGDYVIKSQGIAIWPSFAIFYLVKLLLFTCSYSGSPNWSFVTSAEVSLGPSYGPYGRGRWLRVFVQYRCSVYDHLFEFYSTKLTELLTVVERHVESGRYVEFCQARTPL